MIRYVVSAISGKLMPERNSCYVILDINENVVRRGFVQASSEYVIRALVWRDNAGRFEEEYMYSETFRKKVIMSTYTNCLIYPEGVPNSVLLQHTNRLGPHLYPYDFDKRYEAVDHFDIFSGNQQVVEMRRFKLAQYCKKLTFGLEFETSLGAVPEELCFRDGLIPLRDGSISGVEYSTIVLKRNSGLSLLAQAVKTLKEHTVFNKDCSLHVHVGGFPLDKNVIFRIYLTCFKLENEIASLVPRYSFQTSKYKSNHKDYCKPLNSYKNFEEMYYCLVGTEYKGRLDKPHPRDVERGHKWNIETRYYGFNFINAICYGVNKTVEFRFLRPTYNFKKILLWLYIFGAIIKFGKDSTDIDMYSQLTLEMVFKKIYPPELVNSLLDGIQRLKIATQMQTDNGDYIGEQIVFEDRLFKGDDDW